MNVNDFNNNCFNNLLKRINQKQKKVFLSGDFNVSLMQYNEHKPTNKFLDSLAYIIQPSKHTSHKLFKNPY